MTLAALSHVAGRGVVAVRCGRCDTHTIDDGAVAVVAGHARTDGRVMGNRRRRAIVGPPVRALASRARDGRRGRASSAGCGCTECQHAEERR